MAYEDNPHKNGRPCRDKKASIVVTFAVEAQDFVTIHKHAARTQISCGELLREAIRRVGLFNDRWKEFHTEDVKGETERMTVRLTRPELDAVDRHCRRLMLLRSAAIRSAARSMGLFSDTEVPLGRLLPIDPDDELGMR